MYEDLVQAQQPSVLEGFVLTSLLPSLLVTSLLHAHTFWAEPARETIAKVEGEYIVTRPVPGIRPYLGLRRVVEFRCAGIPLDLRAYLSGGAARPAR